MSDAAGILAYLRARYDEKESAATAATPGPWTDEGGYVTGDGGNVQVTDYGTQDDDSSGARSQGAADSAHIALNDPASVLSDIKSKRAILDLHRTAGYYATGMLDQMRYWCSCGDAEPCSTARLLAQPFRDRPDFPANWRQA